MEVWTVLMDLTRAPNVRTGKVPTHVMLIKDGFLVRMGPDASKLSMCATKSHNVWMVVTRELSAPLVRPALPPPAPTSVSTPHLAPPATASLGTK